MSLFEMMISEKNLISRVGDYFGSSNKRIIKDFKSFREKVVCEQIQKLLHKVDAGEIEVKDEVEFFMNVFDDELDRETYINYDRIPKFNASACNICAFLSYLYEFHNEVFMKEFGGIFSESARIVMDWWQDYQSKDEKEIRMRRLKNRNIGRGVNRI